VIPVHVDAIQGAPGGGWGHDSTAIFWCNHIPKLGKPQVEMLKTPKRMKLFDCRCMGVLFGVFPPRMGIKHWNVAF
jgi:hypothetical protein